MKILLVGEYSGLHNTLAEGLANLGHDAVIVSTGDGFKNYASQYTIRPRFFNRPLSKKFKNGIKRLTGTDLEKAEKGLRFLRLLPKLKGFDHVQLINSDALETYPWLSKLLLKKLFAQNGPVTLLVCGDESPVIDNALSGALKYSILTPYLSDKSLSKYYHYSLKYTGKAHRSLFNNVVANAQSIITSDLDYELPMQAQGYDTHFIPNPVNIDKIAFTPLNIEDKIIIFLGINRLSYVKKGIVFFEGALAVIAEKYADKIEIIITENVPYTEYMQSYSRAHILLDQVYAYDQGYNALEAMAKGKAVFTGAETEFTKYYNLQQPVNINALPDTAALVTELSRLIENPAEIIAIGKRARAFIEREHDYREIAERYLNVWNG